MADLRFYESARPLSIQELETLSGASFEELAPKGVCASGVAPIEDMQAGHLGYAERKAENPVPGAIIFTKPDLADSLRAAGCVVGVTGNPRAAFARSAGTIFRLKELEAGDAEIHPTARIFPGAFISAGAKIGPNAIIEPNVVIGPGVEIGEAAIIHANAVITCATIGARTKIGSCTVIGKSGFAVVLGAEQRIKVPHFGRAIIGSDVSIGASCSIDRGLFDDTSIGDNCQIDNFCQIAHNVQIGSGTVMAAFAGISGSTRIGRNCLFAGRCATTDNITIGNDVILLADTAAMYDIPDGERWGGSPAMPARNFLRQLTQLRKLSGIKGAQGKKARR
ncbi:MAG: UDP-3-O-(3-hydroxymyristoyl)glucosamine N-acyltransferase [Rhodobacterales bacterium CG15_BIG_FIL_POST_REV_8_21_14_020_59_13]|nr:MAG: UDP-3-O-(3-hydroxymyristoyl)glucosamine N-acyltransferase [Rhodobacterales bacterium CG15_BIG_FIL_POST_REV_8_21_14_020_59_13]